jgi:hypothetical protein
MWIWQGSGVGTGKAIAPAEARAPGRVSAPDAGLAETGVYFPAIRLLAYPEIWDCLLVWFGDLLAAFRYLPEPST